MSKIVSGTAAVLLFSALLVVPALQAQESSAPPSAGRMQQMPDFTDFDLNSDGVLGEAEFYEARGARIAERVAAGRKMKHLANAPDFTEIDQDEDGAVTPEEFAAHQAQRHQREAPPR